MALAGSEVLNSCVQEGWALQVGWAWGAALLVYQEMQMENLETGAWAALWLELRL